MGNKEPASSRMERILEGWALGACFLALALFGGAPALAADIEIGPGDDTESAVASLRPGDTLWLRGGTYSFNQNITWSAVGTAEAGITVQPRPGETAVLEQATSQQNVVEINGARFFTVQGLEIRGGSHGIRLMNSDDVNILACHIHDTGDVAISANSGGTYERLRIAGNHIHDTRGTGEGLYFGCNSDGCRVADSIIENNYIHHTVNSSQGDGIELKEGSYGNIIRNNVIHDTRYPGILTYSTVGNGAPNIIEGNVIWNVLDNTLQVAADARIRNNVILGNVSFQPHQAGSPGNIEFVNNTVISTGTAVSLRGISGAVLIANNAAYSASGAAIQLVSGNTSLVQMVGNVGAGGIAGPSSGYVDGNGVATDFVAGHYGGAPPIDPFPAPGSALVGAASASHLPALDFNGSSRAASADAGAYRFSAAGNPGWVITDGFKVSTPASEPSPPTNVRLVR